MLKRELFKILKEIGLVENGANQFAVYKVEGIDQYKISDKPNKDGLYASLWKIQGALESEFLNLVEKEVK